MSRGGFNYFNDDNNPFRSRTMSSRLHSSRPLSGMNPTIIISKPSSASTTSIANHIAENGEEPIALRCHGCDEYISTKISYHNNRIVHGTAIILFLCGLVICAPLPYLTKTMKDIFHICPNCEQFLGVYKRGH